MRARRMVATLGVAAAVGMSVAPDAQGEPSPLVEAQAGSLRWRAPTGCPERSEVEQRLAAALGDRAGEVSVRAEVEAAAEGGFGAQVVLGGAWGETSRTLDSPTCDTLVDAIVLLAQVSLQAADEGQVPEPTPEPDPEGAEQTDADPDESEPTDAVDPSESEPSESEPTEAEPTAVDPTETAADEPRPEVEDRSGDPAVARGDRTDAPAQTRVLQGMARGELTVGGSVMPQVDLGGRLALGLSHRWFRLEVLGGAWIARTQSVDANAELRVQLFAGELRGCGAIPVPAVPWLRPLACAGVEAGVLQGQGQGDGFAQTRVAREAWIAAVITPAVVLGPWRRIGIWVGPSLVVPARRPRFALSGTDEVYRAPGVAGRATVGFELRLP